MYGLLLVNIAVGIWTVAAGASEVYQEFGFIPDEPSWPDVFTSMFLHGSVWHLLGNMFFLWMFGDNVEDVVGPLPFLAIYLASGIAAAGAHLVLGTAGDLPLIGASGAISGVLGVYLVFFPRVPMDLALVILFWAVKSFRVTAVGAVFAWLATQVVFGILTTAAGLDRFIGIAFWAHVCGLVAGCAFGAAVVLLGFTRRYADPASPRNPLVGYVGSSTWARRPAR